MIPIALLGLTPLFQNPHHIKPNYFLVLNHLFSNETILASCDFTRACSTKGLDYDVIADIIADDFDSISSSSYGEEKQLAEIVHELRAYERVGVIPASEIRQARFKNLFLIWYISPTASPTLTDAQARSFVWRLPIADCGPKSRGWIEYSDEQIVCFSAFLGYID